MPATNAGQYGYAVDASTSPSNLALVQSHIGHLAKSGDPRGWDDGELGTVHRAASVFSEHDGMKRQKVGMDGTSWYHPEKLSMDSGAINNGVDNPAQAVYGDHATMGHSVKLPMYSFDTSLGGGRVADATRQLAKQSGVPNRWVKTVERTKTYSHIDPISASPSKNASCRRWSPSCGKRSSRQRWAVGPGPSEPLGWPDGLGLRPAAGAMRREARQASSFGAPSVAWRDPPARLSGPEWGPWTPLVTKHRNLRWNVTSRGKSTGGSKRALLASTDGYRGRSFTQLA